MSVTSKGRTNAHADVLIVGAGPSGAVTARYLAECGFSVTCLEQGPWVNASEYHGDKQDFELVAKSTWHHDQNVRQLPQDYPCQVDEADVFPIMFSGVGGGALHYGGQWPRLTPSDFRVRSLDGIADDWPLTYEELQPFYNTTDDDFGVSGMDGDPAYPPGPAGPLPALPINKYGRKFAEGMNALGWHWWPAPNAIASRNYRNLKACVRWGTCEYGCPAGAKASPDLTHWPVAQAHGATIITGARVREITTRANGLATGAVYIDRSGAEHHQPADVVVLAANGVGTARLLLLSSSPRFPDGLANSSGLVGRRLMLHPNGFVAGFYDEPLDSWMGPAGQQVGSMEFYETDESRGFVRGARWITMPTGGPLSTLEFTGLGDAPGWGPGLHQTVKDSFGRGVLVPVLTEDLPDDGNRVTLDATLTDSDNIPAPRIHYRRSKNNLDMMDWHLARAAEALQASGARSIVTEPIFPGQPGHLLGTARMGLDPATSVTDPFGRCHDIENLFIVDGSLFVTSGGVNPTSTICALALRCATQMVEMAQLQRVPA